MLDKERETLSANAEQLANLLTENVPYLLGHYLQNGVLTESEREDIIQADSAQEIRTKLVKTLATKEGISLKAVIEGLNATENQCVSEEINNLLSGIKTGEEISDNGSGDKTEDLSTYATILVDEVIAEAEKATALETEEDEEPAIDETKIAGAQEEHDESTKEPTSIGKPITTRVDDVEALSTEELADKLVETSVEVHTTSEVEISEKKENNEHDVNDEPSTSKNDTTHESAADVNEVLLQKIEDAPSDVPDRSVNFPDTFATIIEDGKHNNQFEDEESYSPAASPTRLRTEETSSHALDTQNDSENEDDDNIDIEKEFVMPPEAETSLNNNSISNGNVTNGGTKLVRMESNDIILDDEKTAGESKSNEGNEDNDNELAAVLARKALVRQQVEMFEKNSPGGPGKIKYSIRAATKEKEPEIKPAEGSESKVKNLKNFFQRLSSSENKTSSTPSGPAKPVGKLKVTFPASS